MDLRSKLQAHLEQLVRVRDPYLAQTGHFYVQQYIRQQLNLWGEVTAHDFRSKGCSHQNLVLKLPPKVLSERCSLNWNQSAMRRPVVIGAHYDAVLGSPGADDNATGVSVLLELARLFATDPLPFPVHLVAFDLEEYGLLGSQAYAAQLKQQNQSLRLMLSLEMLGYCDHQPNSQRYPKPLQHFYPDTGNFIALIGNLRTIPDLIRLRHRILQAGRIPCEWLPAGQSGWIVPDTRRSDHAPFWDQGYGAIMVTDTANLRNPHYHQPSDRLETLDLDFLTSVCRGLAHGIRHL